LFSDKTKIPFFTRNESYLFASFFGFVLGLLIFTFYTPNYYKQPEPVILEINRGLTFSEIIDTLYERRIIPSKTNIKIVTYLYGAEKKIKAGRYKIPNGLSYVQLVELLMTGMPAKQVLVTIPEGIWQSELAQILHNDLGIDSANVMELSKSKPFLNSLGLEANNLEGYLLPETYYFYSNTTLVEVLRKLKLQMDKLFTTEVEQRMIELKINKNQILTLASIIDGESNMVSEFNTIAGVFYNRLKKRMPLQADPTIQYLVRDKRKNRVLYKDLEIKSKFNTYKNLGLPPSPINNPGKDAILAALYPEKHSYLYFVADGNGGHIFASTFEQHEKNVSKYRQWRRNQN